MKEYHKLVRDRIPDIIRADGKQCRTRQLLDEELQEALRTKCMEEWQEYLEAADDEAALEELADLTEVIQTLASLHGFNLEDLEGRRAAKAAERGGFQRMIFLIDAEP